MAGGGGGDSEYEVNINLTALLDVLTNLLFFLMLGSAAQTANTELDGGIVLPGSSAEVPPSKNVVIFVGQRELKVDKEPLAPIKAGVVSGYASGRIDVLYRRLQNLKGERSAKTLEVSDVLQILCDKDVPYRTLHQVLNTAAEAGFPKFRMSVLME